MQNYTHMWVAIDDFKSSERLLEFVAALAAGRALGTVAQAFTEGEEIA